MKTVLFMVFLGAFTAWVAAEPIGVVRAMDCDGRNMHINAPGYVTVVLYSNEDVQDKTREMARAFDMYQGIEKFREIVVVDMRGSLGGVFRDLTHSQMRSNLDKEAKRLIPFYKKNGNTQNPRKDLIVIADFEGKVSEKLGWGEYSDEDVSIIVFNAKGELSKRWNKVKDLQESKDLVKKLLGMP